MSEVNHRRRYHRRRGPTKLPAHNAKMGQRWAHHKRRQLVRKLLAAHNLDDIPGNTPKHVIWDYF